MTALASVFAAIAAVSAMANWWSRWVGHRRTEIWSKPLTLVALIGWAVTLDAADESVRLWFVVGLVFSLLGDLFLLDESKFLSGLIAFLVGHLAYIVGLLVDDRWGWSGFVVATVVLAPIVATVGRGIVDAARRRADELGAAVAVYVLVISTMVVLAAAVGDRWAIIGAGLFVISDALLGWNRFVGSNRWLPLAVMVTYHLGQAGLVMSLL